MTFILHFIVNKCLSNIWNTANDGRNTKFSASVTNFKLQSNLISFFKFRQSVQRQTFRSSSMPPSIGHGARNGNAFLNVLLQMRTASMQDTSSILIPLKQYKTSTWSAHVKAPGNVTRYWRVKRTSQLNKSENTPGI